MAPQGSTEVPKQPEAKSKDREIVAFVVDFHDPGRLVLTDQVAVTVNDKTQYWVQSSGNRKPRKATIDDVAVEKKVRVLIGPGNVAKSVTVIAGE
jgi:hypothetical protein